MCVPTVSAHLGVFPGSVPQPRWGAHCAENGAFVVIHVGMFLYDDLIHIPTVLDHLGVFPSTLPWG